MIQLIIFHLTWVKASRQVIMAMALLSLATLGSYFLFALCAIGCLIINKRFQNYCTDFTSEKMLKAVMSGETLYMQYLPETVLELLVHPRYFQTYYPILIKDKPFVDSALHHFQVSDQRVREGFLLKIMTCFKQSDQMIEDDQLFMQFSARFPQLVSEYLDEIEAVNGLDEITNVVKDPSLLQKLQLVRFVTDYASIRPLPPYVYLQPLALLRLVIVKPSVTKFDLVTELLLEPKFLNETLVDLGIQDRLTFWKQLVLIYCEAKKKGYQTFASEFWNLIPIVQGGHHMLSALVKAHMNDTNEFSDVEGFLSDLQAQNQINNVMAIDFISQASEAEKNAFLQMCLLNSPAYLNSLQQFVVERIATTVEIIVYLDSIDVKNIFNVLSAELVAVIKRHIHGHDLHFLALQRYEADLDQDIFKRTATQRRGVSINKLMQDKQNTHRASVHKHSSCVAKKLKKTYSLPFNRAAVYLQLKRLIDHFPLTAHTAVDQLMKDSALRFIDHATHEHVDHESGVSVGDLLLYFSSIIADQSLPGSREHRTEALIRGCYEARRGNNLSFSGDGKKFKDNRYPADMPICPPGQFNKLIEVMQGVTPLADLEYIAKDVVKDLLLKFANETKTELMQAFSKGKDLQLLECPMRFFSVLRGKIYQKMKRQLTEIIYDGNRENIEDIKMYYDILMQVYDFSDPVHYFNKQMLANTYQLQLRSYFLNQLEQQRVQTLIKTSLKTLSDQFLSDDRPKALAGSQFRLWGKLVNISVIQRQLVDDIFQVRKTR